MIEDIIPYLSKVRGKNGKYTACCPVHNDSTPSMTLQEKDGKVLIHCFACTANGMDVIRALDLPASYLFSEPMEKDPLYVERQRKIEVAEDAVVIDIYESMKKRGEYLSYSDYKRYKLAVARSA